MLQRTLGSDPVALRLNRLFESTDVDDTRERIAEVLQPHRLMPAGRVTSIRSHMDCVRFAGTVVGAIDFGTEMNVALDEMEDYYLFVTSLRGHAVMCSMGHEAAIDESRGVACVPGERFSGCFSPDCEQLLVRIDRASLAAHTGADMVLFQHELDLSSAVLAPWVAQVKLLISQPQLVDLASREPRVGVELERLLISLLLAGQPHRRPSVRETYGIAPVVVRRAEAWMEEHADEPLRLGDIAEAVDVPVRTLLEGFRRFRGTSPMRHLRNLRLERARDRIREARSDERIADIALECGFTHLGRFSQVYRLHFGETPSQTLRG